MVRRGSHPRLSVILVVEGSPSYAMRALESIQNQDLYDLQIVVVCRDAAPGVRHSLQVAADRDIHIDLIDVCSAVSFQDGRYRVRYCGRHSAPHGVARPL